MKILLVEDDFLTRKHMMDMLMGYGECDIAIDGNEAVEAFVMAYEEGEPYRLVCLDVMMPAMDGYQALYAIRNYEQSKGVTKQDGAKVLITTALNGTRNIEMAYELGCTQFIEKPIDKEKLTIELQKLQIV